MNASASKQLPYPWNRIVNRIFPIIALIGTCQLLITAGCDDRSSVHVYQAPKEAVMPDSIGAAAPSNAPVVIPAGPQNVTSPQWVVPDGWAQMPAQQMRYATFQVEAGDPKLNVIIYTFGPESGALLPNVNRWQQQIGATLSDEAGLAKVVTHLRNNQLEIDYVDIQGPPAAGQIDATRMLAAIIPANDQMWFLKFVGPTSKIQAHKADYDAFLKSISFGALTASVPPVAVQPQGSPSTDPHAGVSMIPAFKSYTSPEGWTLDPQERPMRVATFHVSGGGQNADVIISMLPADMFGTPEANMNRWRGQVGLGPITDANTVPRSDITVGGGSGFLVEFTSPDPDSASAEQLVVAQVTKGSHAFFFKLIGPAKLVGQQKNAFNSFLQSIQFATE